MIRFRALVLAGFFLAACCPPLAPVGPVGPTASAAVDARRQQLRDLLAENWEWVLRTAPDTASALGDSRYNDRWGDYSDAGNRRELGEMRGFLARLTAIDTTGFPHQEQLTEAVLRRRLQMAVDAERFEGWLMPITQYAGPHIDLPQEIVTFPFATVKDYDDYLARLHGLPKVLADLTACMRAGLGKGLVPPRILLARVATQAEDIAKPASGASPFAAPLDKFPPAVPEADRARLRVAIAAAIRDEVAPAYLQLAAFVRADYEPHGRADVGEWALPLGAERYQLEVAASTTTTMTADEIHALGLREVARIEAEMIKTAKALGSPDLASFAAAVAKDPARHFHSREDVLARYRTYIDAIYPKLPALFGTLPKAKVEVAAVESFAEEGASAAAYLQGAPDGSRPGRVMVNTGAFESRTMLSVETTAYHEGVPGHHMQIAIAQEITGLPPVRQHAYFTAYTEGWALYAERLGEELGLYQDPYSYYGHLQDEMLRAIRLVVDTGLHAKHWSRAQVVDFFHAHSTSDEVEVQSETDRYIADPGQALGYKIGQLKILALREKAKQALGAKFDLRAFHDVILGSGALPLDVLEQQVDAWIAEQQRP